MATVELDTELPKALVKRIVKARLSELNDGAKRDVALNKDALLAFGESAKVFVSFLTATANDICKDAKRATISAGDVLAALEDLDFDELVPPLQEALAAFKDGSKEKNKKKAEAANKKRKERGDAAAAAAVTGAEDGADAAAEGGGDDHDKPAAAAEGGDDDGDDDSAEAMDA